MVVVYEKAKMREISRKFLPLRSLFIRLSLVLRSSACLCRCLCVKTRKDKRGWKCEVFFPSKGGAKIHTKTTHNLRRTRSRVLRRRPTEHIFYMIINLLLFLTLSQQQHHRHWRSVFSRHTQCFDISHKENFSTLNISFFSGDFFRSAFSPNQQNFPFSRLMIIKCTTSGSCQIISHLTPHAIGRKRKEKNKY